MYNLMKLETVDRQPPEPRELTIICATYTISQKRLVIVKYQIGHIIKLWHDDKSKHCKQGGDSLSSPPTRYGSRFLFMSPTLSEKFTFPLLCTMTSSFVNDARLVAWLTTKVTVIFSGNRKA